VLNYGETQIFLFTFFVIFKKTLENLGKIIYNDTNGFLICGGFYEQKDNKPD